MEHWILSWKTMDQFSPYLRKSEIILHAGLQCGQSCAALGEQRPTRTMSSQSGRSSRSKGTRSAPTARAAPSQGPKRARADQPEQASASSSSRSPDQPQPEDEPAAVWIDAPIPEGAVESTFRFTKENSAWCQITILETTRQNDEYHQSMMRHRVSPGT